MSLLPTRKNFQTLERIQIRWAHVESRLREAVAILEKFVTDRHQPRSYDTMTATGKASKLIADHNLCEAWAVLERAGDWFPSDDLSTFWKAMAEVGQRLIVPRQPTN